MAQTQLPLLEPDPSAAGGLFDSRVDGAFGSFVGEASAQTKLEFIKEMTNKMAWVVGSAYGKTYSTKNSPVQRYAARMVKAILRDHGYRI